jgi:hypothetical protein
LAKSYVRDELSGQKILQYGLDFASKKEGIIKSRPILRSAVDALYRTGSWMSDNRGAVTASGLVAGSLALGAYGLASGNDILAVPLLISSVSIAAYLDDLAKK